MTETFPARVAGPTAKERRYDRQLRLWAASGQQALEESHVLLVNSDGPLDSATPAVAGVVGVEALKNLVLPGIGGFTILDPATVAEEDLGVNFFLEESSLGKSRAEETCKFLQELNPDVEGRFITRVWVDPTREWDLEASLQQLTCPLVMQPILEVINENDDFLRQYDLIIVSGPMNQTRLKSLCKAARRLSIPLIYTHSVGFYSAFSVQLPAFFPVVETHPDPDSAQDLRLTNPWPELEAAAAELNDLDTLDDHRHGHVPYLLLLLHYLRKWKESHNGQHPANYKEKMEFRKLVQAGARTSNPEGGEENFDEAVHAVLRSVTPWSLKPGLREIFEMEQFKQITEASDSFFIIVSAIKSFYDRHGVLPLPGSLPDMKAQSADYINLQDIYKAKSRQDVVEVIAEVRKIEARISQGDGNKRPIAIPEREIETFCKNAAHVRVVLGRDIPSHPMTKDALKTMREALEQNVDSLVPIFVALHALDNLVTKFQAGDNLSPRPKISPPSLSPLQPLLDDEQDWIEAIVEIQNELDKVDGEARIELESEVNINTRIATVAEEVKRGGAGELHNISSLTGGMVAQEGLKILTRQYVPLDNTCVFDGVSSRSETFRL